MRKGPLLSPSQGRGGASSEKLGFELCLATLGGGAAFHEAAADKKLQGNGCLKASFFLGFLWALVLRWKKIEAVSWERWE